MSTEKIKDNTTKIIPEKVTPPVAVRDEYSFKRKGRALKEIKKLQNPTKGRK